ncbi:MAG: hypothetical protein HUU50_12865 [Candidatus Brocadiae bacterium]|nr:hypothetical protein [Candidatus Brocadiia bacterium]
MKKWMFFSILIVLVMAMVLPLQAQEDEEKEEAVQEETVVDEKLSEEEVKEAREEIGKNEKLTGEKLRSVFMATIKEKKLVFIRLTPAQFATTKIRGKVRNRGLIRVPLRLRQINLLKDILHKEKPDARVPKIIRIPTKIQDQKKGIKSFYVVRPLSVLLRAKTDEIIDEMPQIVKE